LIKVPARWLIAIASDSHKVKCQALTAKIERKAMFTPLIEKEAPTILLDVLLRAVELLRRISNGTTVPSRPRNIYVGMILERDILVGKQNDMAIEVEKKVSNFLAGTTCREALITVDRRVRP
jgi:hypothetical protein